MSAVSAMKCTPQKTIASASGLALRGVRELERVADEVGVLHDLVALVEVAEDRPRGRRASPWRRGCGRAAPRRSAVAVLARQLALTRRAGGDRRRPSRRRGRSRGAADRTPTGLSARSGVQVSPSSSPRAISWMVVSTDAVMVMCSFGIGSRRSGSAAERVEWSVVGEVDGVVVAVEPRRAVPGAGQVLGRWRPRRRTPRSCRRKFAGSSGFRSTASWTSRSSARVKVSPRKACAMRLYSILVAEPPERVLDDEVVVEGELGQVVGREPLHVLARRWRARPRRSARAPSRRSRRRARRRERSTSPKA